VSEEPGLETVVGLLDDEHARTILAATSVEPLSASQLAERCDTSRQTVYRRLERLEVADLVTSRTQLREDGHHDTVYRATLARLSVGLKDGEFTFDLERTRPDLSDELTTLWRNF
jgi:predicted ArsR family transcriptional regulator